MRKCKGTPYKTKTVNIKSTALVLEVGSGNNPNPRSDVLVDRYLYDNGQRAGGFRIVIDRPLIVADGYKLPFHSKTFDYVICSHILEHMEDPQKFIKEIERVGKAGYIEVPSDLSERIFGWNFHLWYCKLTSGKLMLRKKTEGERFGGFFHRLIAQQIWFRRFFEEHEDKFYIKYEWKDQVELSVDHRVTEKTYLKKLDDDAWKLLQQVKPDTLSDYTFYVLWMRRRVVKKLKKILRRIRWKLKVKPIIPLLVCPMCKSGSFINSKDVLVCDHCHQSFPLIGSIPIMLSPAERKKGY